MAQGARAKKNQAMAAMMKSAKIERTSGMCPWGCGRAVKNGGEALLLHLTRCIGSPRKQHQKRH